MFNIPERYKVDVKLALKDFIPKDLKPADKKRIRDSIKEVRLQYQIAGEEIPSVVDETYRCQVIQFYEMEVKDIKDAAFIATTYQELIKPFCVIHLFDSKEELISFAVKRLNQTDCSQVVLEEKFLTEKYNKNSCDTRKSKLINLLDFDVIKNKTNKVNLYTEWLYKAYIFCNNKFYVHSGDLLKSDLWYATEHAKEMFRIYSELVNKKKLVQSLKSNSEKMEVNKEIRQLLQTLDNEAK